MKTLKILSACMLTILLSSCSKIEYLYQAAYTFINHSSYNITIQVDCKIVDSTYKEDIAKEQSLTIYSNVIGDYPNEPFNLYDSNPIFYSVTISNGEVELHNSYNGENGPVGLFDNSLYKYIRTDEKKRTKYYEYTFTDDFFKDAYPAE